VSLSATSAVLRRRRLLVLSLLLIALAPHSEGCAAAHHRELIREGLLVRGLSRDAFVDVWGLPTRTYTTTGDEMTRAGWGASGGAGGGFFFQGKGVYDVWEYTARGVTLVFDGGSLSTWKTDKTVEELRQKN